MVKLLQFIYRIISECTNTALQPVEFHSSSDLYAIQFLGLRTQYQLHGA
jgi:hypothetical protein